MNKPFFLFTVGLIFFLADLNAQKSFTNGFIITNNNDTVHCKLTYKPDAGKGDICHTLINGEKTDYNPFQIKGFGYRNNKFVSGIIDSCFAEILTEGEIRLLKHNDIYIQKSGGNVYKLTSERRIVKNGISKYFVDETRWRGILLSLFSDSVINNEVVNRMDFSEKNLIYLADRYNHGESLKDIELKDLPGKSRIDYGLLAGTGLTVLKTKFTSPDLKYLDDNYRSLHPSVGLNFTISLPLISDRLSFQSEVYLTRSSFSSLAVVDKELSGLYYYNTSVKFTTVSIPLSVRYLLNRSDYKIYLEGGLLYNLNLNGQSVIVTEKVLDGVVTTEESPFFKINRNQFGMSGGIEVIKPLKYFNIGASLKYNRANNLSSIPGLSAGINGISFSILFLR
jgi:hypothetical protein